MTREEFWSSPVGIIIVGLIVGLVAILAIRGVVKLASRSKTNAAKPQGDIPRAKSMNYPDK